MKISPGGGDLNVIENATHAFAFVPFCIILYLYYTDTCARGRQMDGRWTGVTWIGDGLTATEQLKAEIIGANRVVAWTLFQG